MGYPIKGGQLYNMVLAHPDLHFDSEESWTARGSKEQMLKDYEGWDSELQLLLDYAPAGAIMRWRLCDHDNLPTWIDGKFALMGDAWYSHTFLENSNFSHPMLPYVAQGAAQAVEDAAVLGIVLSKIKSKDEIPTALKAYEIARKERAEKVQGTAGYLRSVLHLHDGKAQTKRDTMFANVAHGGENPDLWGDPAAQRFLWSFDAAADFEENYNCIFPRFICEMANRYSL
jgi:salicylate hydroxylase